MQTKHRPVFLEIPNIRLPIPGIVSILHRISGVILFVSLPLLLCLLAGTLSSEAAFAAYQSVVSNPLVKLILIGLLGFGYYYTALKLSARLIDSFYLVSVWILLYETALRGLSVAARRLAYRRALAKRQHQQRNENGRRQHGQARCREQGIDIARLAGLGHHCAQSARSIGGESLD